MRKVFSAFCMALSMYTVFPVPLKKWDEAARPLMLLFLPITGLLVGLLWYGLALIMQVLEFPKALYAAVLTIYPYQITGFLHLDGYMDCCDAMLSRRTKEEKQKILKDPHVGAFAVISLAVLFLLCFAFFFSQSETAVLEALIFIPACARCSSALCVLKLKPMSHSQFAGDFEKGKKKSFVLALSAILIICLGASFASGGLGAFLSVLTASLGCCAGILYARAELGGMSGDVAGYGTVLGEAAALAAMIVFI